MSTTSTMPTPLPMEGGFPLPYPTPAVPIGGQPDRSRARRRRLWIKWLTAAAAGSLIVLVAFHGYVAWLLAHPPVAPLASNPKAAVGLDYEDVLFPSASCKTKVSGWYIPASAVPAGETRNAVLGMEADSSRTIVFSHGYGANREEAWVPMYKLTSLVHALNYNVLLFDYGYASKAYNAPATGGREEAQQLLAAVEYAKSRGAQEVVVWGFSMGAGTALQTALLTDDIDAMILDSLFLTSADTLYDNMTNYIDLPRYPSIPLIETLMPIWTGSRMSSLPIAQVMQTAYNMPLYIIHGTGDEKAKYETAEWIAAEQKNPLSRSWIVPDGKHELIFRVHPDEYLERAAAFLSDVSDRLQPELRTVQLPVEEQAASSI